VRPAFAAEAAARAAAEQAADDAYAADLEAGEWAADAAREDQR
jgi:hypothetical protein